MRANPDRQGAPVRRIRQGRHSRRQAHGRRGRERRNLTSSTRSIPTKSPWRRFPTARPRFPARRRDPHRLRDPWTPPPSAPNSASPCPRRMSVFCQAYFRDEEKRDPSLTEIRMLDTYWSDHCRHTTFLTKIDEVTFGEGTEPVQRAWQTYLATRTALGRDEKPVTLMDIALIGMRELKKSGELDNLEVSEEVNAASIVVPVSIDGRPEEEWLVMFKNETHNHPTEIEPFGGAATCLGGASAIRCRAAPTSIRPCASPAPATRARRFPRPCRANCRSEKSARSPPAVTRPTATRSAWPPARSRKSTTPATSPSAWRSAPSSAPSRALTSSAARPLPAMSSCSSAAAPAATASAAPPAPPRNTPTPRSKTPPKCRRATRPPSARSSGCSATRNSPA